MVVPTGPTVPQVRTKLLSPVISQYFATFPCRNHRHGREFDVCQTPSAIISIIIQPIISLKYQEIFRNTVSATVAETVSCCPFCYPFCYLLISTQN